VVRSPNFPNLKGDEASSQGLAGEEGGVDHSPVLHDRCPNCRTLSASKLILPPRAYNEQVEPNSVYLTSDTGPAHTSMLKTMNKESEMQVHRNIVHTKINVLSLQRISGP
jgi:hypothetical protein